jgi:hypothetical protein
MSAVAQFRERLVIDAAVVKDNLAARHARRIWEARRLPADDRATNRGSSFVWASSYAKRPAGAIAATSHASGLGAIRVRVRHPRGIGFREFGAVEITARASEVRSSFRPGSGLSELLRLLRLAIDEAKSEGTASCLVPKLVRCLRSSRTILIRAQQSADWATRELGISSTLFGGCWT